MSNRFVLDKTADRRTDMHFDDVDDKIIAAYEKSIKN